jgi:hypothetical protein
MLEVTHGLVFMLDTEEAKRRIQVLRLEGDKYVVSLITLWPGVEEPTVTRLQLTSTAFDMLSQAITTLQGDLPDHEVRESGKLRGYTLNPDQFHNVKDEE